MASKIPHTDGLTFIDWPINHKTVRAVGYKKYTIHHPYADLYIYFKTETLLRIFCKNLAKVNGLRELGGVGTQYIRQEHQLRITFFDQKREENPHQCLDNAIAIVAEHFGVTISKDSLVHENKQQT